VAKNTKLLNFAFFIENIEDSNTNIFWFKKDTYCKVASTNMSI
jgi:hypothetical protein